MGKVSGRKCPFNQNKIKLIATEIKNDVLGCMVRILGENRKQLLAANKKDLDAFNKDDKVMYDRLLINDSKIDGMIEAILQVQAKEDPVNKIITDKKLENGLQVINKTATHHQVPVTSTIYFPSSIHQNH